MEGDLHRRKSLVRNLVVETGLQGRSDIGGGNEFVFEDDEQEYGLDKAG